MLTRERLLELVAYSSETGRFSLRKPRRGVRNPEHLGSINKSNGYREIMIDGTRYLAHRLAWFAEYGVWPNGYIDHINSNRDANWIANLRDTTAEENHQNRHNANCNNKLGVKGVYFCKTANKFAAHIQHKGRGIALGMYASIEAATAARQHAERNLYTHSPLHAV